MPYRNNNYRDNRLVDRIDAAVLRLHENIARYWQNTTYRSKDVLAKGLNATSLACCTVNIGSIPLTKNYEDLIFSIPLGAAQARRLVSRGRQKTTLEADAERIRRDVYDELYDTKIPRLVVLTGGLYALGGGGGGISYVVDGMINGKPDAIAIGAGDFIPLGIGILSAMSAGYIDRVDIGDPPKRPERKSIREWLQEYARNALPSLPCLPNPFPKPSFGTNASLLTEELYRMYR